MTKDVRAAISGSHPSDQAASHLGGFRFDPGRKEEFELVVHDLWRDARLICTAPDCELAAHTSELIEAREALNDAIAKAERVLEAA